MINLNAERATAIIHSISKKRIAVVGDVMLDRYFTGSVSRISPEAPVPVIDIEEESFHLGGAANVANNLRALGAEPLLCGVIGNDNSAAMFRQIAASCGIDTTGLLSDDGRVTTVKTRIIGNNQHIARLDREVRSAIADDLAGRIAKMLAAEEHVDGIIFEDYNKGVLTPALIEKVTHVARMRDCAIFVDPKFTNFFTYQGATVFKPNRKEAQEALGYSLKTESDVARAGAELLHRLNCENVLLTLGANGMMLFEKSGSVSSVPTYARHVADVSGAGDTAIATLAAAYCAGADIKEAAALANLAAGVVCGEPGVVSIQPDKLVTAVSIVAENLIL